MGMGFFKQTIETVPLEHRTVLVRADYNVPLDADGTIRDDFRIRASLPTLKKLLADSCKVVIISHLGRPEGIDPALSLEPVAQRLAELLGMPIRFVDKTVGDKVKMAIKKAPKNSITVLENLRFSPLEEANDSEFAKQLAEDSGAQYFVQDGFGVVHRAHASTSAITHYLPSVAGLLLEKEYTTLTSAMISPKKPFIAVLGGAKIKEKMSVIQAFMKRADKLIITGAIANTFLTYKGYNVGKSLHEDASELLDAIYADARAIVGEDKVDEFLVLPRDVAVGGAIAPDQKRRNVTLDQVTDDDFILDLGDESIKTMIEVVKPAKTVIWSGPIGVTTLPEFATASEELAQLLASSPQTTSVIGGGDTADFILKWDKKKGESFSLVSTGGSASLELMSGKKLPGIESLLDASQSLRYT